MVRIVGAKTVGFIKQKQNEIRDTGKFIIRRGQENTSDWRNVIKKNFLKKNYFYPNNAGSICQECDKVEENI